MENAVEALESLPASTRILFTTTKSVDDRMSADLILDSWNASDFDTYLSFAIAIA